MRGKESIPSAPPIENNLYPDVSAELQGETNPPSNGQRPDLVFRLKRVEEIRDFLKKENEERGRLRRRYKSLYNAAYYVNFGSSCVSIASSTAAAISLTTAIGAIASLPLGIAAITTGAIGVVSSKVSKLLLKKVEKHERIQLIALSKLSSVNDLVSKALMNTEISDEEHGVIVCELETYYDLKSQVKRKVRNELSTERESEIRAEAEKKGIAKGQEIAMSSLRGMMNVQQNNLLPAP